MQIQIIIFALAAILTVVRISIGGNHASKPPFIIFAFAMTIMFTGKCLIWAGITKGEVSLNIIGDTLDNVAAVLSITSAIVLIFSLVRAKPIP